MLQVLGNGVLDHSGDVRYLNCYQCGQLEFVVSEVKGPTMCRVFPALGFFLFVWVFLG